MPIQILPATAADIPTLVRIELAAFAPHPRIPMLYPRGYTPDLYAYYESKKLTALEDPEVRLLKAIDGENGKIVGAAEIMIKDKAEEEEGDVMIEKPENWPEGANWEMKKWFATNSQKLINESFGGRGKGYIVVDILVVDPEHQHRGIGSELLGWAIREADEKGLQLGLESSPAGMALYRRWGFREVKVIKADMKLFGWEEEYDEEEAKRVWMIRDIQ